ncbi:hypothetical protein ACJX0J_013508, partial [Zea mays]
MSKKIGPFLDLCQGGSKKKRQKNERSVIRDGVWLKKFKKTKTFLAHLSGQDLLQQGLIKRSFIWRKTKTLLARLSGLVTRSVIWHTGSNKICQDGCFLVRE